jgi:hypothetical protein
MDKKNALMDAVAEKVGKRQPLMRRKGKPGLAVMIAVGAPKKAPAPMASEDTDDTEAMPKAKKIAALQEKIAALKAELALLEDEDEVEGEMADEVADESEDDEDED